MQQFAVGSAAMRHTKSGEYSLLKRECPPDPRKRNMGDAAVPHTPSGHKGAGCGPPLWKPLVGMGSGSGKRGRGYPLCSHINAAPADAGMYLEVICGFSAQPVGDFWILPAVRTGRSFVWVSWPMRGQLSPDTFSFPPCTAHFLFGVSKRKWGVHSARQSRAIPCRMAAPCCHQRKSLLISWD